MFKILRAIAVVVILLGFWESFTTATFVKNGVIIKGVVAPTESYRGPPRSPRAIPFNVAFIDPQSGKEVLVSLPSPILMSIKVGKEIPLLINPLQLHEARVNLLSELWAYPCGLLLGGAILLLVSHQALKIRSPFQKVL
jgi:hypothetical protein